MKASIYLFLTLVLFALLGHQAKGQDVVTEEQAPTSESTSAADDTRPQSSETNEEQVLAEDPVQSGPLVDLLGEQLYTLKMVDETNAMIIANYTNEILAGKKVIGLYFSADWCGPCRKFTPDLVKFYERMNNRRGQKDQFEIVFISRCRDSNSYIQYFSHMPWLAMPPEEAMGERGQALGTKYNVKGIPSFVLVDDLGQTITIDAVTKLREDKTGVGFPWRSPLAQLYVTLFPRSLRLMIKSQIDAALSSLFGKVKLLLGVNKKASRPVASASK
mmetsp:Transcript_10982/g.31257  ORF Transcript_10982/g.31257 Transcript_10982/m.31257 type:complete len:274 (-) Transcript_10982:1058-1879(-)